VYKLLSLVCIRLTSLLSFVCAKNAHNMNIPILFRSYESHEIHPECKIWEAARATSAAPTFFKRIEIGRAQPFIDGGVGRNNPSWAVLDEANTLFGARPIGCLVSIGAGQVEAISIRRPGFFQQIIPTDVVVALKAIATDCEDTHATTFRAIAEDILSAECGARDAGNKTVRLGEIE